MTLAAIIAGAATASVTVSLAVGKIIKSIDRHPPARPAPASTIRPTTYVRPFDWETDT